jgi:hypothetical protein
MISKRAIRRLAAAIACVAIIVPLGSSWAIQHMKRDLNADIAWTEVDGPPEQRTRAYKWYPLSYPVLERWSFSGDNTRSQYAFATIVHFGGRFGGPLARHWLATAIDRNPNGVTLTLPGESDPGYPAFIRAMGLSDPAARDAAARRAVPHLDRDTIYPTFDQLLVRSLGMDAMPALEASAATADDARLSALSMVLPIDYSLMPKDRPANVTRLEARAEAASERLNSGTPVPTQTLSPRDAAVDNAVVALNAGDTRGLPLLRKIVDGDLRRLNVVWYSPNLLAVAVAFPNSRFARGCLAYDVLRGGSYFERDDQHDAQMPPGTIAGWQAWLATYPDHPGADDAAYWLGRAQQDSGRRVDAMATYADALERHLGDGDMRYSLWRRLLFLLDVGSSERDLATFVERHPSSPYVPLVQYARAVRRARANDFVTASTFGSDRSFAAAVRTLPEIYNAQDVLDAYRAQRDRWHALAKDDPDPDHPTLEARDRLASAWSDDDGWKIGYVVLFDNSREGGAMPWDHPEYPWPDLARTAQAANQNAQTIALAKPLTEPSVPADMSRRNQRRIVSALYKQQTEFYDDERYMMGALTSLPASVGNDRSLYQISESNEITRRYDDIDAWWARQTIVEAERYAMEYPNDDFAATALLSAYEVTGRTQYLREIVARYPDGSRTDEARALLWRATTPRT